MDIGSYIELDLRNTGEYYNGDENNIARLNSARAGIYHSCRLLNCSSISIPFYLCPTVKRFLSEHEIDVRSYYINENFEPIDLRHQTGQAILLVNYFGILSQKKIRTNASRFDNVIIDNSAAFYSQPLEGCYNVYSPRKFFGVPDGCYVIGKGANRLTEEYKQDLSSDTSLFLLRRIEYGLTDTYNERMNNEERIDRSGILQMSTLSRTLLNGIDYLSIKTKRNENFYFAHELFKDINLIDPTQQYINDCIPMVYPLVMEDIFLTEKLKRRNIYVGRLWKHVLKEVPDFTFEAMLSKYLVPIPIDQRYCKQEMIYIYNCIVNNG